MSDPAGGGAPGAGLVDDQKEPLAQPSQATRKKKTVSPSKYLASLPSADDALNAFVSQYGRVKAGQPLSDTMIDNWSGNKLRTVAKRLGVEVAGGHKGTTAMRASITEKVKQHAAAHPELVPKESVEEEEESKSAAAESDSESSESDDESRRGPASRPLTAREKLPRGAKNKPKKAAGPSTAALDILDSLPGTPESPKRKTSKGRQQTPKRQPAPAKEKKKSTASRKLFVEEESEEESADEQYSSSSDGNSSGTDSEVSSESDEDQVDAAPLHLFASTSSLDARRKVSRSERSRILAEMRAHGVDKPWAHDFVARALQPRGGKGSLLRVYQEDVELSHARDKMEAYAWCRVIDAIRKGQNELAFELAVRRLAGVHSHELSGTWKVADVFELDTRKSSFVPPSHMKDAIKTVNRAEALRKLSEKSSSSSSATITKKATYTAVERKPRSTGGADPSSTAARPTKPPLRK